MFVHSSVFHPSRTERRIYVPHPTPTFGHSWEGKKWSRLNTMYEKRRVSRCDVRVTMLPCCYGTPLLLSNELMIRILNQEEEWYFLRHSVSPCMVLCVTVLMKGMWVCPYFNSLVFFHHGLSKHLPINIAIFIDICWEHPKKRQDQLSKHNIYSTTLLMHWYLVFRIKQNASQQTQEDETACRSL